LPALVVVRDAAGKVRLILAHRGCPRCLPRYHHSPHRRALLFIGLHGCGRCGRSGFTSGARRSRAADPFLPEASTFLVCSSRGFFAPPGGRSPTRDTRLSEAAPAPPQPRVHHDTGQQFEVAQPPSRGSTTERSRSKRLVYSFVVSFRHIRNSGQGAPTCGRLLGRAMGGQGLVPRHARVGSRPTIAAIGPSPKPCIRPSSAQVHRR